jgi:hypothetical protein
VCGSNFLDVPLDSMVIHPHNRRFIIDGHFLVDILDSIIVRYFGPIRSQLIGKEVRILGSYAFAQVGRPEIIESFAVSFERPSNVIRIEAACF